MKGIIGFRFVNDFKGVNNYFASRVKIRRSGIKHTRLPFLRYTGLAAFFI